MEDFLARWDACFERMKGHYLFGTRDVVLGSRGGGTPARRPAGLAVGDVGGAAGRGGEGRPGVVRPRVRARLPRRGT